MPGGRRVGRLKTATLHDRNAHRLEIVGHDVLVVVDVLVRPFRRRRVIVDVGVVRVHRAIRRQARHRGRPLHARHSAERLEQALIQLRARGGLRVVDVGQRHREGHEARSIEPGVERGEVVDRAQQQARADHEDDGQRHLGHHEPAPDVMARRSRRSSRAALLERGDDPFHAHMQKGRKPEDHAGRHRHGKRKQQHPRVDGHAARPWQARRIGAGAAPAHPHAQAEAPARRRRATASRLRS